MATTSTTVRPAGGVVMAKEWNDVMYAGLCIDSIGVCSCAAMLLWIVVYRQYQSTKDRIIALIGFISLGFMAAGSIPQRVYILEHGRLTPLPFFIVFLSYSWWWLLLLVETALLSYSLYVTTKVRLRSGTISGAILRPLNITAGAEFAALLFGLIVSFALGIVSAQLYQDNCRHTYIKDGQEYNGITSNECVHHYENINWAWIGFLTVPLVLQVALWYQVRETNNDIVRHNADVKRSSGMAMALERVIEHIVRPLQWYPLIFLLFAGLYIVWVITLYGAARDRRWAREVGPVTSTCFSLKGVSVAVVFFSTQAHEGRERTFCEQIAFWCGYTMARNPYKTARSRELNESLVGGYAGNQWSPSRGAESSTGELYGMDSEADVFATGSTDRSRATSGSALSLLTRSFTASSRA